MEGERSEGKEAIHYNMMSIIMIYINTYVSLAYFTQYFTIHTYADTVTRE
jgi:hypothetical protein